MHLKHWYELWGFHSGENTDCILQGCDTMQSCRLEMLCPSFRFSVCYKSIKWTKKWVGQRIYVFGLVASSQFFPNMIQNILSYSNCDKTEIPEFSQFQGQVICSLACVSRSAVGSTQSPIQWVLEGECRFPMGKTQPGHDTDHFCPIVAEVVDKWEL
jgi:hypothetical protein